MFREIYRIAKKQIGDEQSYMHCYAFPRSPINKFLFVHGLFSIQFEYSGADDPDKVTYNYGMLINMLVDRNPIFIG